MPRRNYKREYRTFHKKKKQKKNRAGRNGARRIFKGLGRAKKGMDVHHVDGNPTNNSPSNLKLEPPSVNRARK